MSAPLQITFSFMLLLGLTAGITTLAMSTLARFAGIKRSLGFAALVSFTAFIVALMVLTPAPQRLVTLYFWLFTSAVVGGAIGCVTMRNVFHSALMLILSLFGVSGYFILVGAEFLAMVQVIIYIGGIMVLFLFGIMVSQNIIGTEIRQSSPEAPWALAGSIIMFAFMFVLGLFMTFPPQPNEGAMRMSDNTHELGWSLMATYTLPFEVASLLLLMAMIGAIVLVRKD
ncbi:MAG: NADH-quinone oxidoreductase subunit J [bacterium]|nr:NADH-quinone oxidoreductase subunit J [bacterium]